MYSQKPSAKKKVIMCRKYMQGHAQHGTSDIWISCKSLIISYFIHSMIQFNQLLIYLFICNLFKNDCDRFSQNFLLYESQHWKLTWFKYPPPSLAICIQIKWLQINTELIQLQTLFQEYKYLLKNGSSNDITCLPKIMILYI